MRLQVLVNITLVNQRVKVRGVDINGTAPAARASNVYV